MSVDLTHKKAHLEALEKFIQSPAHAGYIAAREQDIRELEETILLTEPEEKYSIAEQFRLRGELRYAKTMIKTFEDARAELKARIDEMIERDLEERTTTKV